MRTLNQIVNGMVEATKSLSKAEVEWFLIGTELENNHTNLDSSIQRICIELTQQFKLDGRKRSFRANETFWTAMGISKEEFKMISETSTCFFFAS